METILGAAPGWVAVPVTALFASIWQGVVLALCVAAFLRLLPGLGAAVRSAIWLAVFVLVALLGVVEPSGGSAAGAAVGLHLDARLALAVAVLWAGLSMVRLGKLAGGAVRLAGIARRATTFEWPGAGEQPVYVSSEVSRPGVVGFLRPRILLPVGLPEQLTEAELAAVLLHEQEHLRRRDGWTNLLQQIGLALLPLHPVLFWVDRRLCRERELACDDHVMRTTGARKAYASCLARLAETALSRGVCGGMSRLALGMIGPRSELTRRVRRILHAPEKRMGSRAVTGAATVALAGLMVGTVGLAHAPRLVSFGSAERPVSARATATRLPAVRGRAEGGARLVETFARVAPSPGLPALSGRPALRRAATARHGAARRGGRRRYAEGQNWVVLTRWASPAPEPVLVPVRFLVPSTGEGGEGLPFATLPTGSGWLVFQL